MSERDRDLIGDVQRLAVEQATAVIGRMQRVFDAAARDSGPDVGGAGRSDTTGDARAGLGRAVGLYFDLAQQTFELCIDLLDGAARRVAPNDGGTDRVDIVVADGTSGDSVAAGAAYLHNVSSAATVPISVVVTDLTSPSGATVPADHVDVEPRQIDAATDRSPIAIALRVELTGLAAGQYHGHLFVGAVAIPIRLQVPGL